MKTKAFFFLIVFLFAGCSITTYYLQEGAVKKTPFDANKVKIFSGDITQEYEVLGSVAVDVPGGDKAAVEAVKAKAASIGANAIIMTKLTVLASSASRVGISGVAVYIK